MSADGISGSPCLIPTRVVGVAGKEQRGFITRMATDSVLLSTSPELPVGCPVELRFRMPSEEVDVEVSGEVRQLVPEGGLWRGRPAAFIALALRIEGRVLPDADLRPPSEAPRRRGSEPAPRSAGLASTLTSGLGRRRGAEAPAHTPRRAISLPLVPVMEAPDDDETTAPPRIEVADGHDDPTELDLQSEDALAPVVKPVIDLFAQSESEFDFDDDDEAPPVFDDVAPLPADAAQPLPSVDESLIPRNVRVPSRVQVAFRTRGKVTLAEALNFSKEGLFIVTWDEPPVVGAVVFVEFSVWESDLDPVRFRGEVRWHRPAIMPGGAPGFGLHIESFESPDDHRRYEELLRTVLVGTV